MAFELGLAQVTDAESLVEVIKGQRSTISSSFGTCLPKENFVSPKRKPVSRRVTFERREDRI